MKIRFDKTGAERKALVAAISKITGEKAQYMGAPGFDFRVGDYTVLNDGTVDTGDMSADTIVSLMVALAGRGIVPSEDVNIVAAKANAEEPAEATEMEVASSEAPEAEASTVAQEEEEAVTAAAELSRAADAPVVMSIDFSADSLTDIAFDNVAKLVQGKAALIRKALGADLADGAQTLPVLLEDGRIRFPWFRFGLDADSIAAWSFFTAALCETAKKQKRVTLKEKPLGEGDSEKFAMRVFLLKLGFIGDEYKDARKVILAGLSGDGSHKSGRREAAI